MLILPKKISHIAQCTHLSVVCQNPSYVNYTFRRKFLQQKGKKNFLSTDITTRPKYVLSPAKEKILQNWTKTTNQNKNRRTVAVVSTECLLPCEMAHCF